MVFEVGDFTFKAPPAISRARRVLIKPAASYPEPYPVSTSRELLSIIIEGIRRVSDADIILLEGTPDGSPIYSVYKALGYDFPRVLTLDVKDSIWVEVENPLTKPLVVQTFWIPNIILSSDYLISVAPLKVIKGRAHLSIMNLLTLLPCAKYASKPSDSWQALFNLGIDQAVTDLYFTLPFDLGIVEARQKFVSPGDPTEGKTEECGKIFIGEPYEVDCEVAQTLKLKADYLNLIRTAKAEFEG